MGRTFWGCFFGLFKRDVIRIRDSGFAFRDSEASMGCIKYFADETPGRLRGF